MDPRVTTDRMKAACQGIALNPLVAPEIKTIAQAVLDANAWLDGFYKDIQKLTQQNASLATQNADLATKVGHLESRIYRLEQQLLRQ